MRVMRASVIVCTTHCSQQQPLFWFKGSTWLATMSLADVDEHTVAGLYLEHAIARKRLSRPEQHAADRMCEAGTSMLLERAKSLVKRAEGALLISYGSDATPMRCKAFFSAQLPATRTFRRVGSRLVEFLCQNCIVEASTTQGEECAFLFKEPVPLRAGKGALPCFSALVKFFPLARSLGFKGIVVSHYVFDRALQAPLFDLVEQHRCLFYERLGGPAPRTGPVAEQENQDWVVSTGCAAHDAHNAAMWAARGALRGADEKDILKKLHNGVEALRNAFDYLQQFLPAFVATHLSYRTPEESNDKGQVYVYWRVLCFEEDLCQLMASLDLEWVDGELKICQSMQDEEENLVQVVSDALLCVFKLVKATESRWLSLGHACRTLVGAWSIGLEALVAMIRADPCTHDYYIKGTSKLPEVLRHASVIAMSSHLPERALQLICTDDRLAQQADSLTNAVQQDMYFLSRIGTYTWSRLAKPLGCSASSFKTDCIHAALAAASFLHMRVFKALQGYPWRLCTGDLDKQIEDLASHGECPGTDLTTIKIWTLAREQWPRSELKQGLMRLAQCRWSTVLVEQAHGAAAAVHKAHKEYGANMLAVRAAIVMMRPLFTTPIADTLEEHESEHMQNLLDKACKGASAMVRGRNLFLQDVLRNSVEKGEPEAKRRKLWEEHANLYAALDDEFTLMYEQKAAKINAERAREGWIVREQIMMTKVESDLEKRKMERNLLDSHNKFQIAKDQLSDQWKVRLAAKLRSPTFSERKASALRQTALQGPQAPAEHVVKRLSSQPCSRERVTRFRTPRWVRIVCWCRTDVFQAGLRFQKDNEEKFFAVLFALQNPLQVGLVPLTKVDNPQPSVLTTAGKALLTDIMIPALKFTVDHAHMVLSDDEAMQGLENPDIIEELHFTSASLCHSYFMPVPLDEMIGTDYEETLARKRQPLEEETSPATDEEEGQSEDRNDLLQGIDAKLPTDIGADSEESDGDEDHKESPEEAMDLDAFYKELLEKRMSWQLTKDHEANVNFKVTVLGGKWTMANKKKAFDFLMAAPKGDAAKKWMKCFFQDQSIRFSFERYGDRLCTHLCLHWCRIMEYFLTLWLQQDIQNYVYTKEDIDGKPPPAKLLECLDALPLTHPGHEAYRKVMALVPQWR